MVQEMPTDATIKAIVKEKGIQSDEKDSWLNRMGQGLAAGVMLVGEAAKGRAGFGVPRAHTEVMSLPSLLHKGKVDAEGFVEVQLTIGRLATGPLSALGYGKAAKCGDYVTLRMRWLNFAKMKQLWVGSDKLWTGPRPSTYNFSCLHDKTAVYEPIGQEEILRIEGCSDILQTWKTYYQEDPFYDDVGESLPPIKKVRAVHGVNIPTEAAYALRVHTIRLKKSKILTRLVLDDDATLPKIEGLSMQGGVVHATGTNNELSGDGVVPLSSLDQCRQWAKQGLECELSYLPGVEHRAILADEYFHQTIKDVVLVRAGSCAEPTGISFSIAGTFSAWKPRGMTWDGQHFVYVVCIGPNGWESFQILLDGSWEKVFYPDVKDANMTVPHCILGPDKQNAGKDWTIGKNRGKLLEGYLRSGSAFKVKLEISGGRVEKVFWEPFTQAEKRILKVFGLRFLEVLMFVATVNV